MRGIQDTCSLLLSPRLTVGLQIRKEGETEGTWLSQLSLGREVKTWSLPQCLTRAGLCDQEGLWDLLSFWLLMAGMRSDLMLSQLKSGNSQRARKATEKDRIREEKPKSQETCAKMGPWANSKKTSRLSIERSRGQKNGELEHREMIFWDCGFG